MSPLLTARPSVSVTLRLVGPCVVTAVAAGLVALAGHGGGVGGRPPACLSVGVVCAALVAHMFHASWKAVDDGRLAWMAAGVTVAFAGLVTTLLAMPALVPADSLLSQSGDAAATRYLIIHLALVVAGALAIAGVSPRPRSLLIFGGLGFLLLAWAAVDSSPVGGVPTPDGIGLGARGAVGLLALAQVAVAILWWRRSSGAPPWVETCVLACLGLGVLDMLAYLAAPEQFAGLWWASLALRAGQFAVPAVGLLLGFIAVSEKLRDFQDELTRNLVAERERAQVQQDLTSLDERRRDRIRGRMQQLIDGAGLDVAFQPIVDLASGRVVGAEALARFTG